MANRLGAREALSVGTPTQIDSMSGSGDWYVIFEDDGATGYLYACDCSVEPMAIRSALHVYDVRDRAADGEPVTVDIVWSTGDASVALAIDDEPQAAVDLSGRRSTCLTSRGAGEFVLAPEWDEGILAPFYE